MTLPPPLSRHAPGWWSRHWRWAVPLVVLLTGAAAVATVWFVLVQWSHWIRASEPYQEAMRRARCNVELAATLGEPIRDDGLPMGGVKASSDGSGLSQVAVTLNGPQGEGRLYLHAERTDGQWDYPMLYVVTGGSHTIDLSALDDAEAASQCALATCRAQGQCPAALPALEV
ncbi:cytochrome c oxidase assembly factor Coa1 family protein [Stenotrophomonas sp.]|uniref:cytochrome c oxidase assembly factor Coa1 family protein n=1 Tax=Stenotrophomonas sp. TaxID=69392 RepID=UPI002FC583B0